MAINVACHSCDPVEAPPETTTPVCPSVGCDVTGLTTLTTNARTITSRRPSISRAIWNNGYSFLRVSTIAAVSLWISLMRCPLCAVAGWRYRGRRGSLAT
jgi:hypothetical protein